MTVKNSKTPAAPNISQEEKKLQEAKKIIATQQEQRMKGCMDKINATLQEMGFVLDIQFSYTLKEGLRKEIVCIPV